MPENAPVENPFDLNSGDFISQIDYLSEKMTEAYYLHLYSYSAYPASQRNLPPFLTPGRAPFIYLSGAIAGKSATLARPATTKLLPGAADAMSEPGAAMVTKRATFE